MSVESEIKWIYPEKKYWKCPICEIGYLDRRVPRDPFVKYLLFWRDVKRYKCNNCQAKVYIKKRARVKQMT